MDPGFVFFVFLRYCNIAAKRIQFQRGIWLRTSCCALPPQPGGALMEKQSVHRNTTTTMPHAFQFLPSESREHSSSHNTTMHIENGGTLPHTMAQKEATNKEHVEMSSWELQHCRTHDVTSGSLRK